MKKKILVIGLALTMLCATGCETQEPGPAVSENALSVAQEIANGVSQNVIPAEALEYYTLAYTIPDGFVRNADSTDTLDVYFSEQVGDYSYITYMRQENDGSKDYSKLTGADYKAALDEALAVDTVIESIQRIPGDGNMHVKVLFSYTTESGKIEVAEHIFITDKYVFEMVYGRDPEFDWKKAFAESEGSLRLVNVAQK